jgi:transcriptional regulator with XRE-family HTH domain
LIIFVYRKIHVMSKTLSALHGQKLCWLRFTNGNSKQVVIAKELGISQQEYSEYERGKRQFSEEFINRICKYYKIDLADFLAPINNGVLGDSQQDFGNETNTQQRDVFLIQSAHEAYKTALQAKNEMITVLKELLEARK